MDMIQHLFARIRDYLRDINETELTKAKTLDCSIEVHSNGSVLQSLFTLGLNEKSHSCYTLTKTSQNFTSDGHEKPYSSRARGTSLKESSTHEIESKFSEKVEWNYKRYFLAMRLKILQKVGEIMFSFRWQEVLMNFLYLGFFLLAQDILFGFLENFQNDIVK